VSNATWEGGAYTRQAAHHRSLDDWFLSAHSPQDGDVVVEAGCGTGEFTARLAALVPNGRVVGVEPDESMLEQARAKSGSNLEFLQGTLQELDRACAAASADLVVSRAVFHWLPWRDYARAYTAIFRILRPGGWFHAESGAAGNVRVLVALLDDVALHHGLAPARVTFPDAGTAIELLERSGFRIPEDGVTTVAQRRTFDKEGLLGFVRTQASLAYTPGAPAAVRDRFLADVEGRVDELRRHDGTYDQTFVRLHVLCTRSD
jgi:ubiquinone/menaquinone biosynthesis C-methylase UbiE